LRKIEYWVIPPKQDAEFVACMEEVLDTYAKAYANQRHLLAVSIARVQYVRDLNRPISLGSPCAGGCIGSIPVLCMDEQPVQPLKEQIVISFCSSANSPMRRSLRHWLVRQLSSHSATLSQTAVFGGFRLFGTRQLKASAIRLSVPGHPHPP
jgi:hypothetical protein